MPPESARYAIPRPLTSGEISTPYLTAAPAARHGWPTEVGVDRSEHFLARLPHVSQEGDEVSATIVLWGNLAISSS